MANLTQPVSELTPEELTSQVRLWRKKVRERRQRLETRRAQAWEVARRGATMLKKEFGVKRVVVFGSLCHPNLFHEQSDVDLAVAGMNERQYLRALGRLLDLDADWSIDLIELESARPNLRQTIEQDGVDV